jgi:hypothetical protein
VIIAIPENIFFGGKLFEKSFPPNPFSKTFIPERVTELGAD